jgi:hypothetical protein
MIYTGAYWSDLAWELPEGEDKIHYSHLLNFMTPIIKAYCSDMGFRVCETAIQCLGGYGYCKDYPLEQYLRDSKIMSLYEGTNGIQSTDLLGRKMIIQNGGPFNAFMKEVKAFCSTHANHPELGNRVSAFSNAVERLSEMALGLKEKMISDPLQWASYTYPALMAFGEVTMVWRILDLAIIAHKHKETEKTNEFYMGKVLQATYYTDMTLPHILATIETCNRQGREVVDMPVDSF